MLVGTAVHLGIERRLKGLEPLLPKDLLAFSLDAKQTIDYKDGETLDDLIAQVDHCLEWWNVYYERMPQAEEGDVEVGYQAEVAEGVVVKGYMDVLSDSMEGTLIMDWKTVARLNKEPPLYYYLQALTYKLIADLTAYDVSCVQFVEIKKEPYKREKPTLEKMVRVHEWVEFPQEDLDALRELYRRAYLEITQNERYYLPNVFTGYDCEEQWEEFKQSLRTTDK